MINKIDGNGYYEYSTPKKVDIPNTGEKFNLGYQKEEFTSELKDEKEKEVSDQEKQQAAERSGVRVELSSKGVEKQKQAEATASPNAFKLTDLLETIRTFLNTAVATVKDIFDKIWNDPQPEEASQDASEAMDALEREGIADAIEVTEIMDTVDQADFTGIMEDAARSSIDEEKQDREIRQHLKNGDMNQVIRLLTDNGRKTVAKNSTLLTSYDKNGRVVELDASVRERTLYGDRHVRKL